MPAVTGLDLPVAPLALRTDDVGLDLTEVPLLVLRGVAGLLTPLLPGLDLPATPPVR